MTHARCQLKEVKKWGKKKKLSERNTVKLFCDWYRICYRIDFYCVLKTGMPSRDKRPEPVPVWVD